MKLGDGTELYQHANGNIIAGRPVKDDFFLLVAISTRRRAYPIEPTQLDNVLQVSMVNVQESEADQGYTKNVYMPLCSRSSRPGLKV